LKKESERGLKKEDIVRKNDDTMSKAKYNFNEELESLAALVKLAETTTVLDEYLKNKISREATVSKIYL
jgi:hypothetical protein